MRSPAGRGGGGLQRRLPGDGCSGGRRQRKGATTALPGRRRSRVTVAPGRPSRVRPRRADRPSQEVIDPGPTSRDEGDDAHRIRYRLDCRRSRSQGQRPFRVDDRPSGTSGGAPRPRRSLTGPLWPVSAVGGVVRGGVGHPGPLPPTVRGPRCRLRSGFGCRGATRSPAQEPRASLPATAVIQSSRFQRRLLYRILVTMLAPS